MAKAGVFLQRAIFFIFKGTGINSGAVRKVCLKRVGHGVVHHQKSALASRRRRANGYTNNGTGRTSRKWVGLTQWLKGE